MFYIKTLMIFIFTKQENEELLIMGVNFNSTDITSDIKSQQKDLLNQAKRVMSSASLKPSYEVSYRIKT